MLLLLLLVLLLSQIFGKSGISVGSPVTLHQLDNSNNNNNAGKGGSNTKAKMATSSPPLVPNRYQSNLSHETKKPHGSNKNNNKQQKKSDIPSYKMGDSLEEHVNVTAFYTWEALLLQKLFEESGYSSKSRPAVNNHTPVHVTIELVLLKINELIEIDQEILVSGFLKVSWTDRRLRWRIEDFGGIDFLVSEIGNIWLPDLALINSDDVYALTRDNRFPLRISSNGQVLFVPAGKISARCELDLRFFPFDEQICRYRFESWVYTSDLVQIHGVNLTVDENHYVQNPQWSIIDAFVQSRIVGYESYNFSQVDFYLVIRRKSLFFITYTVFPSVIISSLQVASHLLPFTEPERINFATTTLIAFSVFHISIVEQVPKSSDSVPLLAIYVDSLMCLIGLSLIECFFIMNWISRVGFTVPNPTMWFYLVEKCGRFLLLGSNGYNWRRNYLRVLIRVNDNMEMMKRTENQLKRLASVESRERMRRLSKCATVFHGFGQQDLQALAKLVEIWGDQASDLIYQEKMKTSLKQVEDRRRTNSNSSSFDDNNDEQSPLSQVSFLQKDPLVSYVTTAGATKEEENNKQKHESEHQVSKNVGDDGNSNDEDDEATRRRRCHAYQSRRQNPPRRQMQHKAFLQHQSNNSRSPEPCSEFHYILSALPKMDENQSHHQHNNYHEIARLKRQIKDSLRQQLTALQKISKSVDDINSNVVNQTLKRECIGVWTTYITAVDRLVSIGLFFLTIVVPIGLFQFYPKSIDYSTTAR